MYIINTLGQQQAGKSLYLLICSQKMKSLRVKVVSRDV